LLKYNKKGVSKAINPFTNFAFPLRTNTEVLAKAITNKMKAKTVNQ
jgi:hypothetical protein